MGNIFLPQFEGHLPDDLPNDVLSRVAEAVRTGNFHPGPLSRSQYVLVLEEPDRVRFRARTLLTAIGIGLNDVTLERLPDGGVAYFVSFYRWFYYCLVITLIALAVPGGMLVGRAFAPALGFKPAFGNGGPWIDFLLAVSILFGLGWPFLLSAMHKPIVRRFLEQLVRRACAERTEVSPAGLFGMPQAGAGYEYVSAARLLGLPLVHIAFGPRNGSPRSVARGVIAIGDVALGVVFALGSIAVGGTSLGGVSVGLLALGGCALGGAALGGLAVGLVAVGGLAVGVVAVGGVAIGYYAVGGGAIGVHAAGGGAVRLR